MRYVILVLLNIPVILLALTNIVTLYKTKKVSRQRFRHQMIIWTVILIVLIGSFPLYNYFSGKALLSSDELSLFDIVEITAIILLIYIFNSQRQKIHRLEKMIRNLHQELSIKLSGRNDNDQSR